MGEAFDEWIKDVERVI